MVIGNDFKLLNFQFFEKNTVYHHGDCVHIALVLV